MYKDVHKKHEFIKPYYAEMSVVFHLNKQRVSVMTFKLTKE